MPVVLYCRQRLDKFWNVEGVKRSGGVKKCGCLKNFFIVNMTDFHGVVGFTAFFLEKSLKNIWRM